MAGVARLFVATMVFFAIWTGSKGSGGEAASGADVHLRVLKKLMSKMDDENATVRIEAVKAISHLYQTECPASTTCSNIRTSNFSMSPAPASLTWDGRSMRIDFPPPLEYMRTSGRGVTPVTPIWSASLAAPGIAIDMNGRKAINTEANNGWRSVSSETGYSAPGKYLFFFGIETEGVQNNVMIGVRTSGFRFGSVGAFVGETTDGWAYQTTAGAAWHKGGSTVFAEGSGMNDVIGALLDLDTYTLAFLKNGRLLGVAHTLPAGREFFPCISLHYHGTSILTLNVDS